MLDRFQQLFASAPASGGHATVGRKPRQEDAWYISPVGEKGQLLLVADGVGGHAHGEYASRLAVETFQQALEGPNVRIADVPAFLRQKAVQLASNVWEKSQTDPTYAGCGTTLSLAWIRGKHFYLLHVGDSRVYLLDRSNNLLQLTEDHTLVQRLLQQGEISEEEAATHPRKNVMYSAIGQQPASIRMDLRGPEPLRRGEVLLLCSDGVHDALPDEAIQHILLTHKKNPQLAEVLVKAAFDAGGTDNITACWYKA